MGRVAILRVWGVQMDAMLVLEQLYPLATTVPTQPLPPPHISSSMPPLNAPPTVPPTNIKIPPVINAYSAAPPASPAKIPPPIV